MIVMDAARGSRSSWRTEASNMQMPRQGGDPTAYTRSANGNVCVPYCCDRYSDRHHNEVVAAYDRRMHAYANPRSVCSQGIGVGVSANPRSDMPWGWHWSCLGCNRDFHLQPWHQELLRGAPICPTHGTQCVAIDLKNKEVRYACFAEGLSGITEDGCPHETICGQCPPTQVRVESAGTDTVDLTSDADSDTHSLEDALLLGDNEGADSDMSLDMDNVNEAYAMLWQIILDNEHEEDIDMCPEEDFISTIEHIIAANEDIIAANEANE
jgi:hypothetical protein